jgi:hypothetical protein
MPSERFQGLSLEIQDVRPLLGRERGGFQGLSEGGDGRFTLSGQPQAESDLCMGVPGTSRVGGGSLELLDRLLEHPALLQHAPSRVVVECGRLFHVGILPQHPDP